MTDLTWCEAAYDRNNIYSGDTVIWRSPANLDGTPTVKSWRTTAPTLFLLDAATGDPQFVVFGPRSEVAYAPAVYVGAFATVLSDLVERTER